MVVSGVMDDPWDDQCVLPMCVLRMPIAQRQTKVHLPECNNGDVRKTLRAAPRTDKSKCVGGNLGNVRSTCTYQKSLEGTFLANGEGCHWHIAMSEVAAVKVTMPMPVSPGSP